MKKWDSYPLLTSGHIPLLLPEWVDGPPDSMIEQATKKGLAAAAAADNEINELFDHVCTEIALWDAESYAVALPIDGWYLTESDHVIILRHVHAEASTIAGMASIAGQKTVAKKSDLRAIRNDIKAHKPGRLADDTAIAVRAVSSYCRGIRRVCPIVGQLAIAGGGL